MTGVRLATLRHANLAACLTMDTASPSASEERIRVDLLVARDIRADERMPHSAVAAGDERRANALRARSRVRIVR